VNNAVLTVAEMRAAEQAAMAAGMSEYELMKIAGRGAAEWIWRVAAGREVSVLCGPGNNGGDGYVIAQSLREKGLGVQVIAPDEPKTDTAKRARADFSGSVHSELGAITAPIMVDCLFGYGLSRPLEGAYAALLAAAAEKHSYAVAVDVPSGVSCDSGAILSPIPSYDLTLALGAWKHAHWRLPARQQMGQLRCVTLPITIPQEAAFLIGKPDIDRPAADTHKYRRGLACVVAGDMPGAALLASEAAQRSGAGYVKLLGKAGNRPVSPSLVTSGAPLEQCLSDERIAAVLIGPGLGRGDRSLAQLQTALEQSTRMVIDADALHLVQPAMISSAMDICATPHDGELLQLCTAFGVKVHRQGGSRAERASALAKASGMVILAKGPESYVAAPDGRLAIAPPAPSWLSVAGSGDVLAGITLSRMATGEDAFSAACQAVWLHTAAAKLSGAGFTAQDLAEHASLALAQAI
jgi:hydroxyethylthiazole kinase-like uncharacterized protein yjeF